ncbi:MAG: DUF1961 family protein [Candidatus Ornithomonoglobus sp.]
MKKKLKIIALCVAAAIPFTVAAAQQGISILINGNKLIPKDANGNIVEPFLQDGTTYLPIRAVSEALGKNVSWDGDTQTVSITDKNISYEYGDLIYENPLASEEDTKNFVMEGDASVSFPEGKMRLENNLDPSLGQASNYVYWCDKKLPDSIIIEWSFKPLNDDGLAIMFFSADGQNGKDLFDSSLAKRDGQYKLYHSGDINAFHVSYYRHSTDEESCFHVCNLRKSAGFQMVAQGADPLPPAEDVIEPYRMKVIKDKEIVRFYITDSATGIELMPFEFTDNEEQYGKYLEGGYIGFRQKAPLIGEYSDLKVYKAVRKES